MNLVYSWEVLKTVVSVFSPATLQVQVCHNRTTFYCPGLLAQLPTPVKLRTNMAINGVLCHEDYAFSLFGAKFWCFTKLNFELLRLENIVVSINTGVNHHSR